MIPFILDFAESNQCIDLGFGDVQVATRETVAYTTGTVTSTTGTQYVEHGLGRMPRFVIAIISSAPYEPTYGSGNKTTIYNESLASVVEVLPDGTFKYYYLYLQTGCLTYYKTTSTTTASYTASKAFRTASGTSATLSKSYSINGIDEDMFVMPTAKIGSRTYRWFAIA